MQKKILHKNIEVAYEDRGEGPCMMLLHGYLETGAIWRKFTDLLVARHRVIAPDLPGHGQSGTWSKVHSMDELAGTAIAIMEAERIRKAFLVGHSMGGYVAMAFADLYPGNLLGYCLFHSTCFADSEDKRKNRDREISLVLCHKTHQIINVNIPKAFAQKNLERLSDEVALARNVALSNSEDGIIALLNGMKERPDRSRVLRDPSIPLLIIGGMRDNYIGKDVFEKLVRLAPQAMVVRLAESGHMGFMEEPELAASALRTFVKKNRPVSY